MSLALLQGYSSAEDDDAGAGAGAGSPSSLLSDGGSDESQEEDKDSEVDGGGVFVHRNRPLVGPASSSSSLPSVLDVFAEVAGPPQFLNNAVAAAGGEAREDPREVGRRGRNRSREKKDLPAGVVVEAKAQLIGIRDRVRSDIEGSGPPSTAVNTIPGEGKRVISASNPEAKDAADLLRMCLQCGIPKTYSHTRGMVCPVCGDRPLADPTKEPEKKKGSTIKDKEKSKRMKGQSSHASWKSETEMQLRQHYD